MSAVVGQVWKYTGPSKRHGEEVIVHTLTQVKFGGAWVPAVMYEHGAAKYVRTMANFLEFFEFVR